MPTEVRAELSQSSLTKVTLKLINLKEFRLLNYQLTDKALNDPKYRDHRCIVALLYAEKIKIYSETVDSKKLGGGLKIVNYDLFMSTANESQSQSQKSAEKVFIGFKSTLPGVARGDALRRSAMLPGWGQFYKGENLKGSLFSGGFILGSLITVSAFNDFQAKKSEYESAKSVDLIANLAYSGFSPLGIYTYNQSTALASQVNQAGVLAQTSLYGLSALYIFNLFDAYFLGSTLGEQKSAQSSPIRMHYAYYRSNLGSLGTQQNYELGFIGSF